MQYFSIILAIALKVFTANTPGSSDLWFVPRDIRKILRSAPRVMIVAGTINFQGGAEFSNNCAGTGTSPIGSGGATALVE
jgi:hypothetical protein